LEARRLTRANDRHDHAGLRAAADLIMATQRVYCIPSLPSRIVLPIVP